MIQDNTEIITETGTPQSATLSPGELFPPIIIGCAVFAESVLCLPGRRYKMSETTICWKIERVQFLDDTLLQWFVEYSSVVIQVIRPQHSDILAEMVVLLG